MITTIEEIIAFFDKHKGETVCINNTNYCQIHYKKEENTLNIYGTKKENNQSNRLIISVSEEQLSLPSVSTIHSILENWKFKKYFNSILIWFCTIQENQKNISIQFLPISNLSFCLSVTLFKKQLPNNNMRVLVDFLDINKNSKIFFENGEQWAFYSIGKQYENYSELKYKFNENAQTLVIYEKDIYSFNTPSYHIIKEIQQTQLIQPTDKKENLSDLDFLYFSTGYSTEEDIPILPTGTPVLNFISINSVTYNISCDIYSFLILKG